MHYEVINLREEENGFTPTLTAYILDNPSDRPEEEPRQRPAVVVCPGGGYGSCSKREAEPIAMQFLAAGFHAFVLNYSVAPFKFKRALEEVSMSIALVRKNAEKWDVLPDKIAVCGFSAGGHLACSIGTLWNSDYIEVNKGLNKPNAMILGYPVITYGEFTHQGTFENLCGDDEDLKKKLSLETQVSKDTPPAFIWHTYEDQGVPVENSLVLAGALRKAGVPFDLHIYQKGGHGLSTATPEVGIDGGCSTAVPGWIGIAASWLKDL